MRSMPPGCGSRTRSTAARWRSTRRCRRSWSAWFLEAGRGLRCRGLAAAALAARLLGGRTGGAEVVKVVRVLDQAVVDVVADLPAGRADEVDAFDRLVDALAVEDATAQLLDADAEQLFVLALDLAP